MNPSNDAAQRQPLLLAAGALDPLLARHVQEQAIELAVIGLHEQPGVLRVLMGSTAERLLRGLPAIRWWSAPEATMPRHEARRAPPPAGRCRC